MEESRGADVMPKIVSPGVGYTMVKVGCTKVKAGSTKINLGSTKVKVGSPKVEVGSSLLGENLRTAATLRMGPNEDDMVIIPQTLLNLFCLVIILQISMNLQSLNFAW